jgi:hypothetical protein
MGDPLVRRIEPLPGLTADRELVVVHDADAWERFLARQPAEPALRLRALDLDFDRQTFVLARYTAGSGATVVHFDARLSDDGVLRIVVRANTPSGIVRQDVVFHHFAAVLDRAGVRAELVNASAGR